MSLTIFGAYGGANIGDEVILAAVVREFERRGYACPYTVVGLGKIADELQRDWYRRHELRYVNGREVLSAVRAAWNSDLFIGGGQLIDGSYGPKLAVLQLLTALCAKASGHKVALGGVGAYRIDASVVTRFLYSLLFALADSVGVRDADSLRTISYSGAARAKAKQTADIVFSLSDPAALSGGGRKTIAFSVHHAPHAQYSDHAATLALLTRLAGVPEFEVVITAHDKRQNFDVGFAENLVAELPPGSASVRTFAIVEDCLEFYRQCHTVISARMHPVIIGACLGANCVPMEGSPKMREVATLLQVPLRRPESLLELNDRQFLDAIGIGSTTCTPDRQGLAELQAQSLDNFAIFPMKAQTPAAVPTMSL